MERKTSHAHNAQSCFSVLVPVQTCTLHSRVYATRRSGTCLGRRFHEVLGPVPAPAPRRLPVQRPPRLCASQPCPMRTAPRTHTSLSALPDKARPRPATQHKHLFLPSVGAHLGCAGTASAAAAAAARFSVLPDRNNPGLLSSMLPGRWLLANPSADTRNGGSTSGCSKFSELLSRWSRLVRGGARAGRCESPRKFLRPASKLDDGMQLQPGGQPFPCPSTLLPRSSSALPTPHDHQERPTERSTGILHSAHTQNS
eukprot:2881980-Rhodomonas_salina.1